MIGFWARLSRALGFQGLGFGSYVTEETARSKLVPQFEIVPHAFCLRALKALLPA